MITYFKNKITNSKKIKKMKCKTIIKSHDTFIIIATTSSSFKLSPTRIGLIVIPISSGIACGLTFCNKVIDEIVMQKINKYKKQYERSQQTIKSFEKLNRKIKLFVFNNNKLKFNL